MPTNLGTLLRVDEPVEQALQRLKDEDDQPGSGVAALNLNGRHEFVFLPGTVSP